MDIRCSTCKYESTPLGTYPCSTCNGGHSLWEPIENGLKKPDGENVNHPQHYNHGRFECIEVMVENFGKEAAEHFCLLNAFKYVWRTNYKNGVEDVKKAMFYLDYYLKLEGEKHDD